MRDVVLVREGVLRRPGLARGADGGPPAGHVAPDFGGLGCGGFRRVVQDARFTELVEQRQGFRGEAGGLGVPVEQERDVRGKRLRQRRPRVIEHKQAAAEQARLKGAGAARYLGEPPEQPRGVLKRGRDVEIGPVLGLLAERFGQGGHEAGLVLPVGELLPPPEHGLERVGQ